MMWEKVEIGKVSKVISGFAFKSRDFQPIGTPVIKIKNIKDENIVLDESDCVDSAIEVPLRFHLSKGDILISLTGSHITLPSSVVGRVAKYRHETNSYLNQRAGKFINIDNAKCYNDYLFYFLLQKETLTKIANKAQGAANQANISPGDVEGVEINLPPLPTQRKITSILSAYDDLIENNLRRMKLLEEKAAIAYKTEFGNYQVSNKEFASLPKGWSVKIIGDIFGKLESGSRPKGGIDKELKEGIASVGAENVIGLGKYNYQSEKLITLAFFENMNRGIIEDRDILIYKDGAYIGKTTLFQDGFPHEKCCVNEHVFLLTSKDVRYQYFLFFTLNQGLYFEKMQQLNANAAQPGINQESLKSLKLIWPSEDKIEEFNKEVEASVKLIFVLAKQNTKLREARDILLPKLMNGQIEV